MATVNGTDYYFIDMQQASGGNITHHLLKDKAGRDAVAPTEASSTASAAYATGSYFFYNGVLYQATADIASGGTITPNTNCKAVTVGGQLGELKSAIKPFAGIVEFESGAFLNDRITKGDNVKRIRNVSPIPLRDFFSITLPTGYSMYVFWFTKSMTLISSSSGHTDIKYSSLKSGSLVAAYYANVQISKDDASDSDISSYVSTLNSDTVVVQRSDTDKTLAKEYSPADAKTVGDLLNDSIINVVDMASGTDFDTLKSRKCYRLVSADASGYVVARFEDGHIKTKNFDSSEAVTQTEIEPIE